MAVRPDARRRGAPHPVGLQAGGGGVDVDVDGVVKLIHRYGKDTLTWRIVDISLAYTI